MLANVVRVFVVPGQVFASMRSQILIGPPLAALVVGLCVLSALQVAFISPEEYARMNEVAHEETDAMTKQMAEFLGQTFSSNEGDEEQFEELLVSQEEMMDQQLERMNTPESLRTQKQVMAVFTPMLTLFSVGLVVLLEATYFLIVGNMMKCSKQWSDWIGFTLWTTLPVLLFFVLYVVATLWTGSYRPIGIQAPLSWIPGLEHNVFALSLTVPVLWTVWIRTVGMHHWIEKPIPNCLLVVLIPAVLGFLINAGSLQLSTPYMDQLDNPTTESISD